MLSFKEFPAEGNPSMEKYYNMRKAVRTLYDDDIYYGDLCGSILHIRDKNRCINSMSTKIQDHVISVDFDENTEGKKKEKIINEMLNDISSFIVNNASVVAANSNITEEDIENYAKSTAKNFCDAQLVGNNLVILL